MHLGGSRQKRVYRVSVTYVVIVIQPAPCLSHFCIHSQDTISELAHYRLKPDFQGRHLL